MKLIGLMGAAGAGKDSVADVLERAGWTRRAFADPLRRGLATMLGLTDAHWRRDQKEEPIDWLGRSPRELLQTLGTEWGRDLVHHDVWVLVAEREIDAMRRAIRWMCISEDEAAEYLAGRISHPDATPGVVFADVRFPGEAEMLRRNGGVLWRIERPGCAPVREHVSETAAADVEADHTVVNDGTLLDLEMRVAALLMGTP